MMSVQSIRSHLSSRSRSAAELARRFVFLAALGAPFFSAAVLTSEHAEAQAAPKADVLVIHAATVPGAGAMDPKLAGLRQLGNVPFKTYNSFKLLDTKTLPLAKNGPSVKLPNGYNFSLSLGATDGKTLHIVPSLSKSATPSPLPEISAKADEPFFVAGQSYENGILIIAVTPHL